MSYTAADLIVDTIAAAGVKRIWGIPGDSLNGFTDALRTRPELAWMHVRHEEGGAFAASAEAAMTGELAAVAGSCGPGNLHFINGLYDAHRSRVPVLAIASQIPGEQIGTNYFQETHPENLYRECSSYCEVARTPEQLARILNIAIRTAVEDRGVSVLVIPGELFVAKVDEPQRVPRIRAASPVVRPSDEEVHLAAAMLNDSQKVTILAGAGCAGAHDDVVALAQKLKAPVVHAYRGKEHIEYNNPCDVGMTGLVGFASGYHAMESCDTLLMLGTDFPYNQFLPAHARVIQLDIRGSQIGRRTAVDLPLVGSVADTVPALTELIDDGRDPEHLDTAREDYARTRTLLDEWAVQNDDIPIRPEYLTRLLDQLADDDAVFVPDVGSPIIWAARYLTMNGRRRLLGSFSHGSMANALTMSTGIAAATPGRQVVSLSGDGGLAMLMGELLTLVQNKLPVKIVVYNNSSLNFVELEMKADGFVNFGTDLENPDFAAVAEAVGIAGWKVTDSSQLRQAVTEFLAHDGPALLDVTVARQELTIPPAITAAQVKGFTLWGLRTVLSGRGDELLDLAEVNLLSRLRRPKRRD
ncbi:pyruvate dehydrogenase [Gordonia hirsuta DSM 44140 = NBRC 16056]|uniref:Pyruvate dehydrogenase n=1 Tax=Gordonia hirsuta DSM 44140 = NBRC 16056 TaxID=1121927 RepID=L7LAU6_9ACTN|nr:ubiquinone-dependent pyruvate dehydrogenase [Gordonia hirsuta]GAC57153.1 pyruvate dehydrogenase [Gordonia hirsuta DSM 44140 = NBRC 16056]